MRVVPDEIHRAAALRLVAVSPSVRLNDQPERITSMYLEHIDQPSDLDDLTYAELDTLADEIRTFVVDGSERRWYSAQLMR